MWRHIARITTLLWLGALSFTSSTFTQAAEVKPAGLPADSASAQTGMERREIRAQLLPRRFTTIAAEINAKINRLPVPEGGVFKAGQLIVGFDCTLPQAALRKARAELNAAEQTNAANNRLAELHSIGQVEVVLSRNAVEKAGAEVAAQQAILSKCTISAPFSGRIAEQKVRELQYVQPGQPLLDIIDDSILELEFLIPSVWLNRLKIGQSFQVEIDEMRRAYPVRIIRIGARIDPVSQSVKITAAIDGKFPELISGMSGRVRLHGEP